MDRFRSFRAGRKERRARKRERIKAMLPPDYLLVCESGIHTRADIDEMQAADIHAFLVGGALMQAEDPGAALTTLLAPAE